MPLKVTIFGTLCRAQVLNWVSMVGVREDHISKVLHPFKPLLQVFRGPLIIHFDSLGVGGAKKVKNHRCRG